jgi:hypothetical protein
MGFRLLGTPIGSNSFAHEYYNEQISEVTTALNNLTKNITDIHTRLKLFSTCTIQKLPCLLDSGIMHNLPQTFNNENWYNWNGPLTQGIDSIVNKFLTDILQPEGKLPTYSMLIAHLNTNQGGLGLLNASHKATPNFVTSMMTCQQRILQGFQINKDTKPIYLHDSIADLFDRNNNSTSDCLT